MTSPDLRLRSATDLGPTPRPELHDLTIAVHGGPDVNELRGLGLRPEEVLDFSANTNPYGPSPAVAAAVAAVPLDRYPDRECLDLRAALADHLGVPAERILAGNGAAELIWLAALAFVRPGSRVLVVGPTFGEYARAAALMGGRVALWQAREDAGFAVTPGAVADRLDTLRPAVAFLCNPNNPTGTVVPADALTAWAGQHPRTLFVVDEAYRPFAPGLPSALGPDNVLVIRSMTKDCGLAGLRLGYTVGPKPIVAALRRAQPPWSVNAPAQAAGVAALRDRAHRRRSLEQLAEVRHALVADLAGMGLIAVPSATHFFLLRVGDGAAFRAALLWRGVLVRDCASFGLPPYVRVSTRLPADNARLLAALAEVRQ